MQRVNPRHGIEKAPVEIEKQVEPGDGGRAFEHGMQRTQQMREVALAGA
ncbi:hypothetical protein bAD24_III02735 [Burkholderia sp. AD24]|nr:hypothetical protein bAD24_III02735 [Burkholderia sp. AD24]